MRDEYDFSRSIPNPYVGSTNQPVVISLDRAAAEYFQQLANEAGISQRDLIQLYLKDCVNSQRKPSIAWVEPQPDSITTPN
jgi:hypothetical protein